MKQSGRASLLTVVALAAVLMVAVLLFFGKEPVGAVGARFLTALSSGDVDTLTKMSYLGNDTEAEMRKKWDFAVNTAGRYYRFAYQITSSREISNDTAQVTTQFVKNAGDPASYPEKVEIPLV